MFYNITAFGGMLILEEKMKKLILSLLMITMLTGCVSEPVKQEEVTTTNEDVVTTVETTVETTELRTVIPEISDTNIISETQEYVDLLMADKTFMLLENKYEYVQVVDLNNDDTPEIIIECNTYSFPEEHYCYVFSKNENGVFAVRHSGFGDDYTVYSYYGSLVSSYSDENGNNVFISDFLYGGANTGNNGKKIIIFDGKEINEKNLYTHVFENGVQQYQFFDYELTLEKECDEYDKYISSLKENEIFSRKKELFDKDGLRFEKEKAVDIIKDLLDEFYE